MNKILVIISSIYFLAACEAEEKEERLSRSSHMSTEDAKPTPSSTKQPTSGKQTSSAELLLGKAEYEWHIASDLSTQVNPRARGEIFYSCESGQTFNYTFDEGRYRKACFPEIVRLDNKGYFKLVKKMSLDEALPGTTYFVHGNQLFKTYGYNRSNKIHLHADPYVLEEFITKRSLRLKVEVRTVDGTVIAPSTSGIYQATAGVELEVFLTFLPPLFSNKDVYSAYVDAVVSNTSTWEWLPPRFLAGTKGAEYQTIDAFQMHVGGRYMESAGVILRGRIPDQATEAFSIKLAKSNLFARQFPNLISGASEHVSLDSMTLKFAVE